MFETGKNTAPRDVQAGDQIRKKSAPRNPKLNYLLEGAMAGQAQEHQELWKWIL